MSNTRLTGIVDWYDQTKGFGVVKDVSGATHFLYHSQFIDNPEQVIPGTQVSFVVRARSEPSKTGTQACEVTIIEPKKQKKTSPLTEGNKIVAEIRRIKQQANSDPTSVLTDITILWNRGAEILRHPEVVSEINSIAESHNLQPLMNSDILIKNIDPAASYIASGLWQGSYIGTRWAKNGIHAQSIGWYVTFGNNNVTLLGFIFSVPGYKNQGSDICWRVTLLRDYDGRVIQMPRKDDGSYNSYRQGGKGFELLQWDIRTMIDLVK
jgi:cold shock CspA family protein